MNWHPDAASAKSGSFKTYVHKGTGETYTLNMNNPKDVEFIERNQENLTPIPTRAETGGAGAFDPGRSTIGTIQKSLADDTILMSNMQNIKNTMSDRFLTYEGQFGAGISDIKSKLGVDLSADQAKHLTDYTKFQNRTRQVFNSYRKLITGAAAAEKEMKDLEASIFNINQGPVAFRASLDALYDDMQRGLRIKRKLLRDGFNDDHAALGDRIDTLVGLGIDDDVNVREQELMAEGLSGNDLIDRLIEEGYE